MSLFPKKKVEYPFKHRIYIFILHTSRFFWVGTTIFETWEVISGKKRMGICLEKPMTLLQWYISKKSALLFGTQTA